MFGSYRRMSLSSIPVKVYSIILIERVQDITKDKISEEHCGFRTGRGCID